MKGMINSDNEIYNICLTPIRDVDKFNSRSERIVSYLIVGSLSLFTVILLTAIL